MLTNLADNFRRIFNRLSALERAVQNMIRVGNVVAVDNEKDTAEISVGKGDPIDARAMSFGSGAVKLRITVSKDQAVTLFCPGGDARQAFFVPGDWTGKNESPSSNADEVMLTIGAVKIIADAEKVVISAGGSSITITESGIVTEGNVDHNNGHVRNDGVSIDKGHKHKDVTPGPAPTGIVLK
ncbi:MAG: hypothetical protein OIF56_14995 [Cohaesibacter sp.]|nr:hypothetical protein [Cohaesibacter sp.]